MKLGIRFHLAGLSLSNTIRKLENFGVKRSRKAVQIGQKADLQSADDANPDYIALDEACMEIGILSNVFQRNETTYISFGSSF